MRGVEIGPALAVWTLVVGPWLVRLFVAGSIWSRVRGIPPSPPNTKGWLSTLDFPPPNQPGRAFVHLIWSVPAAFALAMIAELVWGSSSPGIVWVAVYGGTVLACVYWALRRLRHDDRLARDLRASRIQLSDRGAASADEN